jgi:hypothetical protein
MPSSGFTAPVPMATADGTILIRPGEPIIVPGDLITPAQAARLLARPRSWVKAECEQGRFATACKPGRGERAQWRVSRAEIIALRHQPR